MANAPRPAVKSAPAPAPLIDQRFVAGFLIGPLFGAVLYALIVGLTRAGEQGFWFYLATSLAYGYATSLIVLLPALLILRHLHFDGWLACAALGLVTGILFYQLVFDVPASSATLRAVFLYGALPFLLIALAIRLIAGHRA